MAHPFSSFNPCNVFKLAAILDLLVSSQVMARASQPGTLVSWGTCVLPYVQPDTRFSKIAAGGNHSLALKQDGTVVAWGAGSPGTSGFANYGQATVPGGLTSVVAIAAGYYHSLALKQDGTVVAWGDNSYGQTNVPSGLSGVAAIAGGGYHNLALKQDGTVVAWGDNSHGQLSVPDGLSNVLAIVAGFYHNLALKRRAPSPGGETIPMASSTRRLD